MSHTVYMKSALSIARQGLGRVAPNPTVGCVLVKDGRVIARARTADGGRPHAEPQALESAGESAKGSTAYVTLEPCSHVGKTGPCAQALIDAGVKEVVVAIHDNDPRVSGRGIEMLKAAGVKVTEGVCSEEAYELNKGFFLRAQENRPLVTIKVATTLDSKIATATGQSKWITGDQARQRGHLLRAKHDAIAVGVNTVLSDDPSLTTRLNGVEHQTTKVVFDTNERLSGNEKIFNDPDNPVLVMSGDNTDIKTALKMLVDKGITRLLVEGGATLASSFIKEGLFDQLYVFQNSSMIGGDGLSAIQNLGIENINDKIKLNHHETYDMGDDRLDIYMREG